MVQQQLEAEKISCAGLENMVESLSEQVGQGPAELEGLVEALSEQLQQAKAAAEAAGVQRERDVGVIRLKLDQSRAEHARLQERIGSTVHNQSSATMSRLFEQYASQSVVHQGSFNCIAELNQQLELSEWLKLAHQLGLTQGLGLPKLKQLFVQANIGGDDRRGMLNESEFCVAMEGCVEAMEQEGCVLGAEMMELCGRSHLKVDQLEEALIKSEALIQGLEKRLEHQGSGVQSQMNLKLLAMYRVVEDMETKCSTEHGGLAQQLEQVTSERDVLKAKLTQLA